MSNHSSFDRTISWLVVPKISSNSPNAKIDPSSWGLPSNIMLADPAFNIPGRIDLLIGAELYFSLLLPADKISKPGHPTLVNTELGWILSGPIPRSYYNASSNAQQNFLLIDGGLDDQIRRFWELEEILLQTNNKKNFCEDHFCHNTTRDEEGRYIVRLPSKETLDGATARFLRLEKRLSQDEGLREEYIRFLKEHESMGYMELADSPTSSTLVYYLPHHLEFKESSTTKVRFVFDASFKSSSGLSLNDTLHTGPTIQQNLCSIVLRSRTHQVCFTADIEKMYRQIRVNDADCELQRILWCSHPEESIKQYKLKTVTYGTAPASFLSVRSVHQLVKDEGQEFPLGSQALERDMYVDEIGYQVLPQLKMQVKFKMN
ncbi:uncharacterized protein LOC142325757 [Lycorma delicatula]|uniref:uncharacterized protein LOC142325757 n=1 Tax=Lycorma delicatula TaxID=130591 RepID=UPI003F50EF63